MVIAYASKNPVSGAVFHVVGATDRRAMPDRLRAGSA
jgi:hypothetical protein